MEELENISENLQKHGNSLKLVDDKGEPMVYDEKHQLYITDIMVQEDGTVCALVPLGYFSDKTIQFIEKLTF